MKIKNFEPIRLKEERIRLQKLSKEIRKSLPLIKRIILFIKK